MVNIVLRRDFVGAEVRYTYNNTFKSDSANQRIDLTAGLALEGGKTQVFLNASRSTQNLLLIKDRDLLTRGRQLIAVNNPAALSDVIPLSYYPNIRSTNGSNLELTNGIQLGSPIARVPAGYAGPSTDSGTAIAQYAGRFDLRVSDGAQFGGGSEALLNAPSTHSIGITARREFSNNFQVFGEFNATNSKNLLAVSNTPSSYLIHSGTPANPFNQDIYVSVPMPDLGSRYKSTSSTRRATFGMIASLPAGWKAEVDYTWSRSKRQYSLDDLDSAALNDSIEQGKLDVLRDLSVHPLDLSPYFKKELQYSTPFVSNLTDFAIRTAGKLVSLPAGEVILSALGEKRKESLRAARVVQIGDNDHIYFDRYQAVDSVYAELQVPIWNAVSLKFPLQNVNLQAAVRQDWYESEGVRVALVSNSTLPVIRITNRSSSINPTVGIKIQQSKELALRVSYATGFRPPSYSELTPIGKTTFTTNLPDPRRGGTAIGTIELRDSTDIVRPETSKSWSAGLIYSPKKIPDFRLSIDYTRIEKSDNIRSLSLSDLIAFEEYLPGSITRGPNLPGDAPGWAGPVTSAARGSSNIAGALVEAIDAQLDYSIQDPVYGSLDLSAIVTWQPKFQQQVTPAAPVEEFEGISPAGPVTLRGNYSIVWSRASWTVGISGRYYNAYSLWNPFAIFGSAYDVEKSQGSDKVKAQTYHDIFVTYKISPRAKGLSRSGLFSQIQGAELTFGIKNFLNKKPPFDASNTTNYYSYFGDARNANYYIAVKVSL